MDKDKAKKLNSLMAGINKEFGVGTIGFLKDQQEKYTVRFFKTPSLEFNIMLGGGLAVGRFVEFYGENSSGKTSMAMEVIAYNQKLDPDFIAGWLETEGSFDYEYAKILGIDPTRLVIWDQKALGKKEEVGAEKAMDIFKTNLQSGLFNIMVVNSVAGLVPNTEATTDFNKANVAVQARLMSKATRVLNGMAAKNNTTVIFINQLRTNVG